MATYRYRCAEDGAAEVVLPIGTAPPQWPCPACGQDMARVFLAPMLGHGSSRAMAAIDATKRSAERPDVVAAPPARPRRQQQARNPALARLPRP